MRTRIKRVLGMLLAVLMIIGMMPTAYADGEDTEAAANGLTPLEFTVSDDTVDAKLHFKSQDPVSGESFADTDVVRVSVILADESVLDAGYPIQAISLDGPAAAYQQELERKQSDVIEEIEDKVLDGDPLDVVWNLTLAANLISANVRYGKIREIEKLDGVARVIVETPSRPLSTAREKTEPKMATSSEMTGAGQLWESGYTGAGSRIAVIDTGIDVDHQSFNGEALRHSLELQAEDKPAGWLESLDLLNKESLERILPQLHIYKALTANEWDVEDIYYSEKIPFAFNYGDISVEVDHSHDNRGEHGSHVAGIAAANAYIPAQGEGEFVKALDSVKVQGVAPDAQLLVMKVFGREGGGYDSDYMAAIEDAFYLGADVVNLSLGTAQMGFSRSEYYQELLDKLTEAGFIIVASAGNEGSWADNETGGAGSLRIEDVSVNTVSSPASYTDVLSVASSDNRGMTDRTLDVGSEKFTFYDGGSNYGLDPVESIKGSRSYVMIDGVGTKEQFEALDDAVRGKLAVCLRGEINFSEKADNAMAAGAIGLIVVNTENSLLNMDLSAHGEYTAPCFSVTSKCGEALKNAGQKGTASGVEFYEGTLTLNTDVSVIEDVSPDAISSFSAWGVPGSLELKPEITAPGGNIYSVNGAGTGHNGYENMSGTSMASPQIAGMTALLAQYIKENGLEEKTDLNAGQLVNSLLMSTAVPITVDGGDGAFYPVLRQGAGLANVGLATQSPSYILMDEDAASGASKGKVKAELGEDAGKTGVYSFGFTINDLSGQAGEYELRAELFTQDVFTDENGTARLSGGIRRLLSTADFQVTGAGVAETPFACDLDGDGDTDENDAARILDYAAGNVDEIGEAADLNGDGAFTTEDAYLLLVKLGTKTLTLEKDASVHVTATLKLDDSAREYLNETYPNGAYIEGYVFVTPGSTGEGLALPEHSIPVLGFYGNWSDAPMFDSPRYTDALYGLGETSYMGVNTPEAIAAPADSELALYVSNYIGIRQFGEVESSSWTVNPYLIEDTPMYGRAAINSRSLIYSVVFSLIRNASQITLFVKDGQGNVVEAQEISAQFPGGFPYSEHDGTVTWDNIVAGLPEIIASPSGMGFREGESFTVGVLAVPEYYEHGRELTAEDVLALEKDGTLGRGVCMSWTFTVDDTAPSALAIARDGEGNLVVNAEDNMALATVVMMNTGGTEVIEALPVEQSGGRGSVTFDLSSYEGGACKILVGDYAGNETLYDVSLRTGDEPEEDFGGQMFGFTAGSRYGVANSWLRIDPDKLNYYNNDDRGVETVAQSPFAVTAAEYVGGYVYMAAGDGNMYVVRQGHWGDPVLLGSYKDATALVRDMAYNYTNGILYALGENNTIYQVDLSTGALTEDYTVSIVCPADGTDDHNTVLVTLAIDDDGNFYAVNSGYILSSGGFTPSVKGNPQWTFLYKWGAEDIQNGEVANLSPVSNESTGNYYSTHLYGSPYYLQNVFQSMAWDHDNDILYWASGDEATSTETRVVVFKDPASGKAELLDPDELNSGLTQSQIPGLYIVPKNDGTRIPEAEIATSVNLSRNKVELLEGASVTLTADVFPWNLGDKSVVWTSDNEAAATVTNGVVKAVKAGKATITAASAVTGDVKATCAVTVKKLPNIEFSALLTKADGTSAWAEANTKDLGSWTELGESESYIAGTLLDDTIYVHDGDRLYAVDADNFSVRPLTAIDLTWNWPDAAPAPLSTEDVLDGQSSAFGRIVGLVDGIDGGTSIAVMNPEKGTGDDMATRSQFYEDRAVVIAYKGSGTYFDENLYIPCPSREYYLLTESGELWQATVWETYDGWERNTLVHDCELTDIGPTGIDLGGVSSVYGGQSASMLCDEASGCLLVSVCLDGKTDRMYIVDPAEASAVEVGVFGGAAPVVALYQYERISELTVKVRPDKAEIYEGETVTLTASVYPADKSGKVTWSSGDQSVAEVDDNGVVTGKSAGTAVITATCGSASASCTVTVKGMMSAPAGATANAYIVKPDGTGAWATIDLEKLTFDEKAKDDRLYSGAAAYGGKIYAANDIWLTQIDPEGNYSIVRGDALPAGTQILDGTCVYGETVTLNYFDEDGYVQPKEDVQVPGGVVYVTGDDWIMFVDDYSDANTAHGSVLEGYDAAAMTWYGNRISHIEDWEFDEDSYIQEWFMLGADGYLWKVFRRTYVNEFGETVTTPVSDPERLAVLGVEFADRTKVSMTRVKGDGYDGLLISDAADRSGTALYWLDLSGGLENIDPSYSFSKLGVLEGVTDLSGLYTDHDLTGDFVDTTTIGGGGDEGGGEENEDYQQGYEEGYSATIIESIEDVPEDYFDLFIDTYENAYYESYMDGYYEGYGYGEADAEEFSFNEDMTSDYEYGIMLASEEDYFAGLDAGVKQAVIDAANRLGKSDGWNAGYDKGYEDGLSHSEMNPEPPEINWESLMSISAASPLTAGIRTMSANPKADAGTVMAVGGDVSLSGSVSETSVTAKIELSASTNGLVTVEYDPAVLTFRGASGSGQVLRAFKNDSEAGTVTVAYAASGAFTGEALRVIFSYSTGQPETVTVISLSALQLGGTVYAEDEEKGQIELTLPYVPTPVPVPSVTTSDKTQDGETVTETTATPSASVKDGEASSEVSDSMGREIVRQAEERQSDMVVVAPKISGDVSRAEVTIPGETVTDIAEKTDADLRVETPVGSVTLPEESLAGLGKAGDVTVSVEKTEDTVSVQVSAGGKTVDEVPGGVKAAFELKDGEVAVAVSEDGTETIIPKSLVEDGTAYVLLDGSATVKIIDNSKDFDDVDDGDWFEDAVTFASSHELFNGTSDTTFEPETDMSRAMLATVLWRLESEAVSKGKVTFPDVIGDTWYTEGVIWAADTGVITGTDEGVFEPEREVTRQEMAVMLCRYAKNVGIDTTRTDDLAAFTDAADVADWAADAMSWAVSAGLFQGNGSGLLDPTGSASRAQVATVLQRLVSLMVK